MIERVTSKTIQIYNRESFNNEFINLLEKMFSTTMKKYDIQSIIVNNQMDNVEDEISIDHRNHSFILAQSIPIQKNEVENFQEDTKYKVLYTTEIKKEKEYNLSFANPSFGSIININIPAHKSIGLQLSSHVCFPLTPMYDTHFIYSLGEKNSVEVFIEEEKTYTKEKETSKEYLTEIKYIVKANSLDISERSVVLSEHTFNNSVSDLLDEIIDNYSEELMAKGEQIFKLGIAK